MALNGPQTVGTALGAALIAVVDYRLLGLFMAVVVAGCAVPILLEPRRIARTSPGDATGSIAAPWP